MFPTEMLLIRLLGPNANGAWPKNLHQQFRPKHPERFFAQRQGSGRHCVKGEKLTLPNWCTHKSEPLSQSVGIPRRNINGSE